MNKILQIGAAGIFLLISQALFAQSPVAYLAISFSNLTGSNIKFSPLISGTVDFSNAKQSTVASDIGHAKTSIRILRVTRDSVINLTQNDQPVARLELKPVNGTKKLEICLQPVITTDRVTRVKQPYKYQLKLGMMLQHIYQNKLSEECTDWSGVETDGLTITIS